MPSARWWHTTKTISWNPRSVHRTGRDHSALPLQSAWLPRVSWCTLAAGFGCQHHQLCIRHFPWKNSIRSDSHYPMIKVHGQSSPKGGLVHGLYNPIHGDCAIYFYPGVYTLAYFGTLACCLGWNGRIVAVIAWCTDTSGMVGGCICQGREWEHQLISNETLILTLIPVLPWSKPCWTPSHYTKTQTQNDTVACYIQ